MTCLPKVSAVYQELSLIPQLTVAENILLGQEPTRLGGINSKAAWKRAAEVLQTIAAKLDSEIPLHVPVRSLSSAEQQLVEIAKALARNRRFSFWTRPLLLCGEGSAGCFEEVRRLREQGCTVIFISHRLEEVFDLASGQLYCAMVR